MPALANLLGLLGNEEAIDGLTRRLRAMVRDGPNSLLRRLHDRLTAPDAPAMMAVQAEYCGHRAKRASTDVLEQLLAQLNSLDADALISQAAFLRPKLEQIVERAGIIVAMMKAAREGAR